MRLSVLSSLCTPSHAAFYLGLGFLPPEKEVVLRPNEAVRLLSLLIYHYSR